MKPTTYVIDALDAKNRFSELLGQVSRGAEIVITNHDRPVAMLVSANDDAASRRRKATAKLKESRRRYSSRGLRIHNLIEQSRR